MQEFEDLNFLDNCDIDGGLRKKNIFKKSNLAKPLISIITPVLNNEKYFEECLKVFIHKNMIILNILLLMERLKMEL